MDTTRITGIASGMDTESLVKGLMKAERAKVDKLYQSQQTALWKQEQYNEANKDFANFILDSKKDLELSKSLSNGMLVGNSISKLSWVKKASSSDEDILTTKASAEGMTGIHKIKVKELAEGVSAVSTSAVMKGAEIATANTKLSEIQNGVSVDSPYVTFKILVDGEEKDVKVSYSKDDTIKELVKKINYATTDDGDPDTSETSLGIKANFDSTTGRLFLSTKKTGSKQQIKISKDTGNLFTGDNKLHVQVKHADDSMHDLAIDTAVTGKDASIDFNGATNLKYESNNININGIELSLEAIGDATVKVDTDVDSVYEKIKGFVAKYNELIEKMNKKVSEKRYRDYQPLTKEQKESMKEDDIKLWEQKAKSGLLRNDEYMNDILLTARTGLYEEVEGVTSKYNQLTNIGITTDTWKSKGKLVIDERKLKEAIIDDVDGTLELLFKSPSNEEKISISTELKEEWETSKGKTYEEFTESEKKEYKIAYDKKIRSNTGLVNRMFDDMTQGMKKIIDKAGPGDDKELYRNVKSDILIDFVTGGNGRKGSISLLDEDVLDYDKRIKNEEDRLTRLEQAYWKKYTAMETALSKMQSQSSWLAGQSGSM